MYLIQGLGPSEIGKKLDRPSSAICCMVSREGWSKQRREMERRAAIKADEQALTAAREFNESVAVQSQELAEEGFKLARNAAKTKDAKGFVMAAQGTKVFAGLGRTALGMDGPGAPGIAAAQPLAIVFWQPPAQPAASKPDAIDVTPSAEIADLEFA